MDKMNIAVFFGSRSCEHDVSIVSALQLIEAAKAAGFNVTPVYISRGIRASRWSRSRRSATLTR